MKRFEVGHKYEAFDSGIGCIEVLKRTAKFIAVRNEYGMEWRMKIRECEGKNGFNFEYAIDTSAGYKWYDTFTYVASYERKE